MSRLLGVHPAELEGHCDDHKPTLMLFCLLPALCGTIQTQVRNKEKEMSQ